ncbi:MAG: Do family serine endopeptidase [Desulfobacterales bacterium]|nr:Do family serine endopeptidase [Desulfobacterales bacterium]
MTRRNGANKWLTFASVLIIVAIMIGLISVAFDFGANSAYAKETQYFNAPASFNRLAVMVSPAVVNIRTVKTIKGGGPVFRQFQRDPWGKEGPFKDFFERFFGDENQREFKQPSLGSGFIIDKAGFVVTNNHVIEDADQIKVKLKDEREFNATIVGRDPNTDIALLKIESDEKFATVKLGNSDQLQVGQWVVAIGSPFGLEQTVTAGIVSAKGRVIGSGPYDDFIQTDASINPGNSGGPLLNMQGEVVGINTAIVATGQGIGFAIPINLARDIIVALKEEGEVTRGWLGVAIQDLSAEMAEYYNVESKKGVFVADVFDGDPADKAGIKPKDIILTVNGENITTSRQLTSIIAKIPVNDRAKIKLLRNGKQKTVSVKIAKRPEERLARRGPTPEQTEEFGIRVSDLTPEIAQRFNIDESVGVIVTQVATGSKGDGADVRVGDIIKEINRKPVKNVAGYKSLLRQIESGESVNLFILRRNAGFLVAKMTK